MNFNISLWNIYFMHVWISLNLFSKILIILKKCHLKFFYMTFALTVMKTLWYIQIQSLILYGHILYTACHFCVFLPIQQQNSFKLNFLEINFFILEKILWLWKQVLFCQDPYSTTDKDLLHWNMYRFENGIAISTNYTKTYIIRMNM